MTVVMLSGGIDSTVALAHTMATPGVAAKLALTIDYGQTHQREIESARAIAQHYGVEHHVIDLTDALWFPCGLTGSGDIPTRHADKVDNTFVPGRNIVMAAVGIAWAHARHIRNVAIGANADDRAGYPDCRREFLQALNESGRVGYAVAVWTPFIDMSKRQVIELGQELDAPLDLTWSCYRGGDEPCNNCGACESRNKAMA